MGRGRGGVRDWLVGGSVAVVDEPGAMDGWVAGSES